MSGHLCEVCGLWPRVDDPDWGLTYCAWHNRLMRWWSDSYAADGHAMEGRWFRARLCALRDKLRVSWIAETFYALREGGPFHCWPWENIVRWWCRVRGHEWPDMIGVSNDTDEDGRLWYLWQCPRCLAKCSLPDGGSNERAFRAHADYNSIYVGFHAPNSMNPQPIRAEREDARK